MFLKRSGLLFVLVVAAMVIASCSGDSNGNGVESAGAQSPTSEASSGEPPGSASEGSSGSSGTPQSASMSGSMPESASESASAAGPIEQLGSMLVQTYPANQGSWAIYVAQQRGIFAGNGIEVANKDVNSGTVASAALASGSVDVATIDSTIAGPLLDGGQKIQALTAVNVMSWHLITTPTATPDDTTFKAGVQSLKGKRIGVTAIGSGSYFALLAILKAAGLSDKDVTIVPTGSLAAFDSAFRTGQIDAGCIDHGTYVRLDLTGADPYNLVDLSKPSDEFPASLASVAGVPSTSYWAQSDWVADNPKIVAAFQKSMAQTVVWMQDPANNAELVTLLTQYGTPEGLDPKKYIDAILPTLAAYMPVEGLDAQEKFNVEYGIQKNLYSAVELIAPNTPGSKQEMIALAGGG